MNLDARRRRAVRVATIGWLVGWYWKAWFWIGHLREASAHPIEHDGLPALLRAPWLAAVAYALPLAAAASLGFGGRSARLVGAAGLAIAAAAACAHVELFNDATFVTSFWAALWILWLAAAPDDELGRVGPLLARAVVALVFLGGVVGKLVPAYTSGEALYHIYFLQKEEWPYPALRAALAPETLRALATGFSWAVIACEAALVVGVAAPHRIYVWFACAVMAGMVAISTLYLLSVLAPLAAVLVAALCLRRGSTSMG